MIKAIELFNLGTINKNEVKIETDKGSFSLYFSYKTLVGIWWRYCHNKTIWSKRKTLQNYWSTTTGKLLNELEPNHKARITQKQFDNEVAEMMLSLNK